MRDSLRCAPNSMQLLTCSTVTRALALNEEKTMTTELLRRVKFAPLTEGSIELTTWDTGTTRNGRTYITYEMKWNGKPVFHSDDFGVSPYASIDSDATLISLMSFLSMRPGDTDADYFDSYSERQLEWANSDMCEALQCELGANSEDDGTKFDLFTEL